MLKDNILEQRAECCWARGDSLKYDKTNYNRLYAGELEDWGIEAQEEE